MSATHNLPDHARPHLLPAQPAPLHALALPRPLTSLVGRDAEIAAVSALLDDATTRLLTLTGPGGVGKTRLALAVASELEGRYAHGAWFVSLAAIRDPALVPSAVARAFGIRDDRDRPIDQTVTDLLRDQHLLLVLDNLEHLGPAASWIAELLQSCRRLSVLATSRVPIRIGGEQRYPVPPLAVPTDGSPVGVAQAEQYAALRLFARRATAVAPAFALDATNVEAVATICQRLDGLPLAIELAAARLTVFSPAVLAARLERSLPLLTDGARDAPARLQSLRDAIAWSYNLLSEDEQRFLRWLAVFVGGFALHGAEALAAALGHDAAWTFTAAASLVDQSLLRAGPGEGRFSMLETIREFGLEQLALRGEEDAARAAHAAWVCRLLAEADQRMKGAAQPEWLDRLDAERANIVAALAWLADHGGIEQALNAAPPLGFFWMIRGNMGEGGKLLAALLARPEAAARTVGRARALNAAKIIAGIQGQLGPAQAMHDEALAIFRELGDQSGIAWTLTTWGVPLAWREDVPAVIARVAEGLDLYRALGDRWQELRAQQLLGNALLVYGELTRAEVMLRACRAGASALGDRWIAARAGHSLVTLVRIKAGRAGIEQAEPEIQALLTESVQLLRELDASYDLARALLDLGSLTLRRGEDAHAEGLFAEARAAALRAGDPTMAAAALGLLGMMAQRQGDARRAASLLREALTATIALDHQPKLIEHLMNLAHLAIDLRQPARAATFLGAASRILAEGREFRTSDYEAAVEDAVALLRQKMGDAAFQQPWAAGQALSLPGMLTEAAQLQASIPAPPRPTHGLSAREMEILQRMAAGLTNQQIADQFVLSLRTVTTHITSIHTKLGVESRTAAVAYAIRSGLA